MKGGFDRASKNGKPITIPVNQGPMYTILLCLKRRDKIQLVNIESEPVKVSTHTVQEILRMRKEGLSFSHHSFLEIPGTKMTLSNFQSWKSLIQHFMSD